MTTNLPNTRFYGCGNHSPALTVAQVLAWVATHKFIWYKAPLNISPEFVRITSQVKTWKRNPNRFEFTIQSGDCKYRIDEKHLDRLRLEYPEWHHGITARLETVRYVGNVNDILCLHQSNGFVHNFDLNDLDGAIRFAKSQNMTLTGLDKAVLYTAVPEKARFA